MTNKDLVFRWALWGTAQRNLTLLIHSIGTFRLFFGDDADFVVVVGEESFVKKNLPSFVRTINAKEFTPCFFDVSSKAPWNKWAPSARLAPDSTEIFVDLDVFLVDNPSEIRNFCNGRHHHKFLVMQEAKAINKSYGNLDNRVGFNSPALNSGVVGQRPGASIQHALLHEYTWWRSNVHPQTHTVHDEQGGVAAAISANIINGDVFFLSNERYPIISPRSNSDLRSLNGIEGIHATFPEHPAFDWFKFDITKISNKGLSLE